MACGGEPKHGGEAQMQQELDFANVFGDDDGEFFTEPEDFNDEEESADSSEVARAVAHKLAAAKMLCMFCEQKPRCKSQVYGPCCASDVKGAAAQAKRRGPEQLKAFNAIKKRGGKEFITCIMTFKTECAGCGRGWVRPAFDFAAHKMALVMASREYGHGHPRVSQPIGLAGQRPGVR